MISKRSAKAFCREDISLIENYDKAVSDTTRMWHCHHRRETIFSKSDLIEIGEYYNRPACELIFLTPTDHHRLHNLGKPAWNKGKHLSEDTRKKLSDSHKSKHHSEESRKKISDTLKGKNHWTKGTYWFNNGVKSIRAKECPKGFVKGRIKK